MNRSSFAVFPLALALCVTGCAKHDDSSTSSAGTSDASSSAAPADAGSPGAASPAVAESPDVASASSSAAAPATDAATAAAVESAAPSAAPSSTTVTVNGNSMTVGGSGEANLAKIGVPVYPNAKTKEGGVLDVTSNGIHTEIATLESDDDFATVDGWYQSHVGGSYRPTHIAMGEVKNSSYKMGDESALPIREITVSAKKDSATGKESSVILVLVKEKQ
jgi:hypothetical protein